MQQPISAYSTINNIISNNYCEFLISINNLSKGNSYDNIEKPDNLKHNQQNPEHDKYSEHADLKSLNELFDFQHCIDSLSSKKSNANSVSDNVFLETSMTTKSQPSTNDLFDEYKKNYTLYSNNHMVTKMNNFKTLRTINKKDHTVFNHHNNKVFKPSNNKKNNKVPQNEEYNFKNSTNYILLNDLITGEAFDI